MDGSMANHDDRGKHHHVAPAPPPLLTGSTQWSFAAAEPAGGRAGLFLPGSSYSPPLWRNPLAGALALPAGGYYTRDHLSLQVSPHYASQHGFVGGTPMIAPSAADVVSVDVVARIRALLSQGNASNRALLEANQPRQPQLPRGLAAVSAREDPAALIAVVDRVVQGAGGWGEPVLRRAALVETSSKHWQRLLEPRDDDNDAYVNNTLRAVLGFVFELMCGEFGHHLFRNLVKACGKTQLSAVVRTVAQQGEELVAAAKSRYGVRSVRELLMAAKKRKTELRRLTTALSAGVPGLLMDPLGASFIQTCFSRLDTEQTAFIHQAALDNLMEVARNQYGCLALSKCIDHAPALTKRSLVERTISNAACLSQDPYGNYVVQHIISLCDDEYTDMLCQELKGHCVQLSVQKSGSHVVEKCLRSTGKMHLLEALVSCKKPDQIARDPYGNFVMQTALNILKDVEPALWYRQLTNALMAHAQGLRLHPSGRHVFKLLEQEHASDRHPLISTP